MFVSPNRQTLIWTKIVEKKFFMWNQSTNIVHPNEKNMLAVPNNKMKGDFYKNRCLFDLTKAFWFKGQWWKETFPTKPKQKYCVSQWRERIYGDQDQKE